MTELNIITINQMVKSYMNDGIKLPIVFEKQCGYRFIEFFIKQETTVNDILTYLNNKHGTHIFTIIIGDFYLDNPNINVYKFICENNIRSIQQYWDFGVFYLIKFEDHDHMH